MSRSVDVVGAVLLLLLFSPVLVAAAILIAIDSRGPVLFRQERVGKSMRPFHILKLRTMAASPGGAGFEFKPRAITRAGKWLRRWKLDELPQLWNVVRGEMSLVGSRPELKKYVEMFRSEYEMLLRRRPGLTDPAAIAYQHEAELLANEPDPEAAYVARILPDKLRLSMAYAERRSLASDLAVLLQTVGALPRRATPTPPTRSLPR
jgi:lipopolysaccharide/colanic/teichoic acid biosynthesis glycosyltransferase